MTIPYNSQKDEAVERKKWSIIETTNPLIHDMDFPMRYWAKDLQHSHVCFEQVSLEDLEGHDTKGGIYLLRELLVHMTFL